MRRIKQRDRVVRAMPGTLIAGGVEGDGRLSVDHQIESQSGRLVLRSHGPGEAEVTKVLAALEHRRRGFPFHATAAHKLPDMIAPPLLSAIIEPTVFRPIVMAKFLITFLKPFGVA